MICFGELNVNNVTHSSQVMVTVKNLPTNAGDIRDTSWIPGSGRSLGVGNDNLLQYTGTGKFHGQRNLAGNS